MAERGREGGRAVSKLDLDAMDKVRADMVCRTIDVETAKPLPKFNLGAKEERKKHKDLHISKKSCNFAADLEIIQKT